MAHAEEGNKKDSHRNIVPSPKLDLTNENGEDTDKLC